MGTKSGRGDMPGRLLRLLALLQSRREWSGQELAERLGVTDRTIRRDIDRLRALDYPIQGSTGITGGYRLSPGTTLPPLQLDDDEAIAVALGLATGAHDSLSGIEDSSIRALAKLQQVLPARLRPRLTALTHATAAAGHSAVPRIDPTLLATLGACCRDHELLTFDYRDRDDGTSARRVEPHHLVTVRRLWYLIAYDPDRADWRTFRLDRIDNPQPTHRRFTPRVLPAPDAATYLTRSFASARYRYTATLDIGLPAETVRASLCTSIPGDIHSQGPQRCTVHLTANSAELVTQYIAAIAAIAAIGADYTLDAPAEITKRVRELGRQLSA